MKLTCEIGSFYYDYMEISCVVPIDVLVQIFVTGLTIVLFLILDHDT